MNDFSNWIFHRARLFTLQFWWTRKFRSRFLWRIQFLCRYFQFFTFSFSLYRFFSDFVPIISLRKMLEIVCRKNQNDRIDGEISGEEQSRELIRKNYVFCVQPPSETVLNDFQIFKCHGNQWSIVILFNNKKEPI